MSVAIATFFALLVVSTTLSLATSSPKRLRTLLKVHLALAVLAAFFFFFAAARLAVPYPDSGPVPSGHILQGVVAMYRVSQVFVGTLALIAVSSTWIALRLARRTEHVA